MKPTAAPFAFWRTPICPTFEPTEAPISMPRGPAKSCRRGRRSRRRPGPGRRRPACSRPLLDPFGLVQSALALGIIVLGCPQHLVHIVVGCSWEDEAFDDDRCGQERCDGVSHGHACCARCMAGSLFCARRAQRPGATATCPRRVLRERNDVRVPQGRAWLVARYGKLVQKFARGCQTVSCDASADLRGQSKNRCPCDRSEPKREEGVSHR